MYVLYVYMHMYYVRIYTYTYIHVRVYVYARMRICVMYEHVYKNADTDKNAETQRALNVKDQGSTGRSKGHAPMRMHDLSKTICDWYSVAIPC
jgi:hypothetical protein